MERTAQWVFSQEVPSDIVIKVDDATFPLHKFILVAKSGYVRKRIVESDRSNLGVLELRGMPGGAEAFDKAARYCYGVNFEISVQNVAALRCAAEWLEMTEKYFQGNLAARAEEFFAKAALSTIHGAVAVLKSSEALLPFSHNLRIVQRCADSIASKVSHEANWWTADLALLSPPFFLKTLDAMKARGAAPKTLSTAITIYAGKSLTELLPLSAASNRCSILRSFIESFTRILPSDRDAPLSVGFLCCLLRAAIHLKSSAESRHSIERRISASLDQIIIGDLMTVAFDYSGHRLADLDSIRRILTCYAERHVVGAAAQRTARIVDAFVAQIATEQELPVSKFAGIAAALPKSSRRFDDDLYRAVDIYIKAHSWLDEIEREKACSVMDPLRLSYEARVHASQNKRLPVQVILHAIYYDQLSLRSGCSAGEPSLTGGTDALEKENEVLRSELARMKLHLTEMQMSHCNTSGKSPALAKKPTFFSSVSKRLGQLNPFRQGSKDTSSIEGHARMLLTKQKKRRFSIS